MSFFSPSNADKLQLSSNIRPSLPAYLFCSLALGYSVLLFLIANYLPILTNGAAEILTWVVYSRIVRGTVTFMAAVLVFIFYIRWPLIAHRRLFLLQLLPFTAATAWFFSRLGESVNEYIHYPQYATCVLVWHAALRRLAYDTPADGAGWLRSLAMRIGPLRLALVISAMLGLAEEGFQYIAPRRAFDLQDLALNLMGVWLGGIIVWVIRNRDNIGYDTRTESCGADNQ